MVVVVAVTLLGACGRDRAGSGDDEAHSGGGLDLGVTSDPDPPRSGEPVVWDLRVRNGGDEPATLTFSSGKDGDVVLRRGGEEVYRWSAGRLFTQAVRKEVIGPGEERTYRLEEAALPVEPGAYELVATLAAEPAPGPVRQRVDVVG